MDENRRGDDSRLIRIENKIDKIIDANGIQNERITRLETNQKIVIGFTTTAIGGAIAAIAKAFVGSKL